ncbi:MAG: adenylyltransferase/cytidyltransferase family protein [Lachnospiraceae bacterium]|nr:adenylyltransferase/cytidyltransferase family protein [Lachnospiraceae bacterium]
MIYTQHDGLTILKLNDKKNKVSFDTLANVILERPSNIIYCELEDELYGIISMGDIARASESGLDYVAINRVFTRILPNDKYMTAKNIFHEKENINALPVVNEDNKLLGAYTRWDDLYNRNMFTIGKVNSFYEDYPLIFLVRPCEIFRERYRTFRYFYDYLLSQGGAVRDIAYSEVLDYIDIADLILFVCEDELRAIDTLAKHILQKDLFRSELKTYGNFMNKLKNEFVRSYLCNIKHQGVHVLNLVCRKYYGSAWEQSIKDKFSAFGEKVSDLFPPSMYPQFFGDLYTEEYANSIMHLPVTTETGSYNGKLKDCSGELYNVINGERYTVGQPEKYQKTIYFVGPCFIYGRYVEDKNTIESFLQKHLNDAQQEIKVVNCGSIIYSSQPDLELARIKEMPLKKGDCVVIYIDNKSFSDIPELNLMDILEKYNASTDWMIDMPKHCNHKINALYAEAVYDELKPILAEVVDGQDEKIIKDEDFVKTTYIDRYFAAFNPSIYGKIGSIIMNCNPFTYGHRYLIEEALKIVDFLIIFVVEEDKSVFSFDKRFAMVYDGTKDLNNVMVVPSGPFILSQTTFPEYFVKEADEDIVQNVENDITIFAKSIAPKLNIRYRFVGEEPEDLVTNEYNSAMKRILPKNGIELVEIPRKKLNKQYISASLVRKYFENYDKEKLYELVPKTTLEILFPENSIFL